MSDEKQVIEEHDSIALFGKGGSFAGTVEELQYVAKQIDDLKKNHPKDYEALMKRKTDGKARRAHHDSKGEKFTVIEIEEVLDAVEKAKRYVMKYNANGTNAIITVSDKELKESAKRGGNAIARREPNNFVMTVEGYEKLQEKRARWTAGCKKTFDYICYKLTRQNRHKKLGELNRWAHIDLKRYAEMRGEDIEPFDETPEEAKRARKARENFVAKVKKEILVLCAVRAEWTDNTIKHFTKDKKMSNRVKMKYNAPLLGKFRYNKDFLEIEVDEALANYLCRDTGYIMEMPTCLFFISEKLPVAYEVGEYLARLWSINEHKGNRCGIVSVLKVIETCGDLPQVDEVRNGKREYTKVLKEPLERALNHLSEIGFLEPLRTDEHENPVFWVYCMPDGTEFQDDTILDSNEFLNASIKYCLKDKKNL